MSRSAVVIGPHFNLFCADKTGLQLVFHSVRMLEPRFVLLFPTKQNCVTRWENNWSVYKRRTEIEWLSRRLNEFRRIFSWFERLDVMFVVFTDFALIVDRQR